MAKKSQVQKAYERYCKLFSDKQIDFESFKLGWVAGINYDRNMQDNYESHDVRKKL